MLNPLSDKIDALSRESDALSRELPPEISELITGLGKRAKPEMITEVILKLCAYKSLKASEIAKILGRDQDYITRDYLTPTVDEGALTYTIPAMPNHPDQAYVTPKKDEA